MARWHRHVLSSGVLLSCMLAMGTVCAAATADAGLLPTISARQAARTKARTNSPIRTITTW
jgi:hypothetical protein